jgi:hypothetical protein
MNNNSSSTPNRPITVLALCIGLWVVSLLLSTYALYLLIQPGGVPFALLLQGVAVLTTAAGLGLYRMRRWGVVLFGALGLAGSINHIVNSILRFSALYNADGNTAVFSVISVLGAFLIPIVLIYLVLLLWRKTT